MDIYKIEKELGDFSFSKEEVLKKLMISSITIEAKLNIMITNQIDILHQLNGNESISNLTEQMNEEILKYQKMIFARKVAN